MVKTRLNKVVRKHIRSWLLLICLCTLIPGCFSVSLEYILTAGMGQLNVLINSVPIEQALNDPNLSDEYREKLLWVRQVRDFAEHQLELNAGDSYLYFFDTGGKPVSYNLSASKQYAFEPYVWRLPILGDFHYIGTFDLEMAKDMARSLEKRGYDIFIYGVSAYSTAGVFRDPVYSSLLEMDYPALTDTVIHELTHNTIFKFNDNDYNESVANFVGQTGSLEYLRSVSGENSEMYRRAIHRIEDMYLVNDFLDGVYRDLNQFYSRTDLTNPQKIQMREEVFESARQRFETDYLPRLNDPERHGFWGNIPPNNAWILLNRRYNTGLDIFEQVYQACDRHMPSAIEVFRKATRADDSFQFLQDWLNR